MELFDAVRQNDIERVKTFLQRQSVQSKVGVINCPDLQGRTVINIASEMGYLEIVKYVTEVGAHLELEDQNRDTPLMVASVNGHLDIVRYLIGKRANIMRTGKDGCSALDHASHGGHLDVVKFLVGKGAPVHMVDRDGNAAIHKAAGNGHLDVVQFLVRTGADVKTESKTGCTPLHSASYSGHLKVVEYLVSKGVEVNKVDNEGNTALNRASYQGHYNVVHYLVKNAGADIEMADRPRPSPALHSASYNGHLDVVYYLILKGACVNSIDADGCTALHTASMNDHLNVVKILVAKGAEVDKANHSGITPLQEASREGHQDVVQYLLDHGAKDDMKHGRIPPEAPQNLRVDLVHHLANEGAGLRPLDNAPNPGHVGDVQQPVGERGQFDRGDAGKVTDAHIEKLSKLLSMNHFNAMCVAIDKCFKEAQDILIKNQDYSETYTEILRAWRNQSTRNLGDLDDVLRTAEAGGLIAEYKKLCSTT